MIRIRSELTKDVSNPDHNAPEVIRHTLLQNNSETVAGVEVSSSKIDVQTHNSKVVCKTGGEAEMVRTKDTQPQTGMTQLC